LSTKIKEMTAPLSKKNAPSVIAMTLGMVSMISPDDAQTTCTSSSPECCWVVESWKKIRKTTSVLQLPVVNM
jgi:hypothetical protein